MTAEILQNQADEISILLRDKLRVRGRSLQVQQRKIGRRLPKKLRGDIADLIIALDIADHPKLGRQVEVDAISAGATRVIAHLQEIDPWERFKDRMLGILGAVSAVLIFTFIVVVYVLWQRGLI